MSDLIQGIEDLIEQLVAFEKNVKKLKTASVSRMNQRNEVKALHKTWLPMSGALEQDKIIGHEVIEQANQNWGRFRKLAESASPKTSYKAVLKALIEHLEISILHPLIKRSGFKTVGTAIRVLLSGVTDATLTKYLEEAIICTEQNCVRAAVVLAWCAVASKIQDKLASLGLPRLESEFERMRLDNGLLFRSFTRVYKFSSTPDIQEVPDAYLVLLCRFLGWLDDGQYKQLKGCIDLRNACGHPGGYQPDPVKLQSYFSDLVQLVFSNSNFV
jgi:hypothetical protein